MTKSLNKRIIRDELEYAVLKYSTILLSWGKILCRPSGCKVLPNSKSPTYYASKDAIVDYVYEDNLEKRIEEVLND